ncbi:FAD-binding protein [Hydrogenovibrio kuenenii]|uniref:FAD-binding protein n=1 Tax=Hydrogenovibrio kuenenii TaxID=63658 RepID=UPI000466F721|nr:FAD-binding protein [Hydrogenovibrio kuenenii]
MSITHLQEQIKQAAHEKQRLQIIGNQSKVSLIDNHTPLEIGGYTGVTSYDPAELVVTVKTGTKIADLQQELAQHNQMLAFDTPDYGDSTIGGSYACGLSGPSQPFFGALRDFVLGIKMIDGKGQALTFGGEMIKNVAGYDVARMLVGSKGLFGVVTEISLKVLPLMEEKTYSMEMGQADAIIKMNEMAGTALPISGCAYYQGKLYYRLIGIHPPQSAMPEDNTIWQKVNPFRPEISGKQKLWRVSIDSMHPPIHNTLLIDQVGARRWIVSEHKPDVSHVDLWDLQDKKRRPSFDSHPKITDIKKGLKSVFDPYGIFH